MDKKMTFFEDHKIKKFLRYIAIFVLIFWSSGNVFASFTIKDEKEVGKEIFEKFKKSDALVEDDTVNGYINSIGQLLLSKSNKAPFDFNFSVIKSSAINAFATPGGYIYVNRGLICLTENESQLASVLAHEIAHVNRRHIADIISKSQKVSIGTLAAIIAGAFLGGSGEITSAIMGFSLGAAAHMNLKYSREHEEEADRLGASYLAASGYDVSSALDFLRLMRRYEYYSNSVPSYFLTHPETDFRLRYLDGLVQTTYKNQGKTNIFNRFKKIKVLMMVEGKDVYSALKYYQDETITSPHDSDAFYGLGMAQLKLGFFIDAQKSFQRALDLAPNDVHVLRGLGTCFIKKGQASQALPYLLKAYQNNPYDWDTLLDLGAAYEAVDDYAAALEIYKNAKMQNVKNNVLYYHLATAYGKTNNTGESHYYFGTYFKKSNKRQSALFHFREALKFFAQDEKKSREIRDEIKSLSNKRERESDNPN